MVKKPGGNKRFLQNRNYIRKNDKIRAREVRVIGSDGEMLGVMPPEEALKVAKSEGLDLVEVAAPLDLLSAEFLNLVNTNTS